MTKQQRLARQVGLVAAATMATGLAVAGAADAAPAAHPSASVANDTLTVLGTKGDDAITIGLDGPGSLAVDFGNGTLAQRFTSDTFSSIAVFLRGGDDQFHAGNGLAAEALTVNAGGGDDTVFGGDGDDVILAGAGADAVDGGRGTDTESLGAGDDTAEWNPGEGNDLVLGDGGTDALVFNGSNAEEHISLSANGGQAVLRRDVAAIRMDLDQVEDVAIATLGSADVLTIGDLTGTDVRQANLDLSAQDGTADTATDTVAVTGTNTADRIDVTARSGAVEVAGLHTGTSIIGADAFDHLNVNSGGGNDRVRVASAAGALIAVAVDLGTGQR